MIVVSYGTRGNRYERHLASLDSRLAALGMRREMHLVDRTRQALKCLLKPTVILDALERRRKTVVWLDADTTVLDRFEVPGGEWDIGTIPNTNPRSRSKNPTSAFVLAFRPTAATIQFLQVWKYLCDWHELCPNRQDHKRFTWTREMRQDFYTEIDMSECLKGTLIRDVGTVKEAAI